MWLRSTYTHCYMETGFYWWFSGKDAGEARDMGLIPGLGRSPGGGRGNPLQYSCLENPMDRGAWWATVHKVEKSWTGLKKLGTTMQETEETWV